eukprot:Lankesteria_metandrocarpae@DN957_c0_g1_i1.p1
MVTFDVNKVFQQASCAASAVLNMFPLCLLLFCSYCSIKFCKKLHSRLSTCTCTRTSVHTPPFKRKFGFTLCTAAFHINISYYSKNRVDASSSTSSPIVAGELRFHVGGGLRLTLVWLVSTSFSLFFERDSARLQETANCLLRWGYYRRRLVCNANPFKVFLKLSLDSQPQLPSDPPAKSADKKGVVCRLLRILSKITYTIYVTAFSVSSYVLVKIRLCTTTVLWYISARIATTVLGALANRVRLHIENVDINFLLVPPNGPDSSREYNSTSPPTDERTLLSESWPPRQRAVWLVRLHSPCVDIIPATGSNAAVHATHHTAPATEEEYEKLETQKDGCCSVSLSVAEPVLHLVPLCAVSVLDISPHEWINYKRPATTADATGNYYHNWLCPKAIWAAPCVPQPLSALSAIGVSHAAGMSGIQVNTADSTAAAATTTQHIRVVENAFVTKAPIVH